MNDVETLPPRLAAGLARSHLPVLDGIRAIAAFLVVFYHCGLPMPGGLGVLAFFVLSGFLITWLMLAEDDAQGTVSLRRFYARRTLRIFPPFYVYWILLTGSAVLLHRPIVWPQSIASLLYVNNYYQALFGDPNTGLSHTWSLAIEEQFYLLWPALFLFLRHDRKTMAKALVALIVGLWIYRLVLRFGLGVGQGYVYEAFDTRADHLMIGCLLAVMLREGRVPRLWRAVTGRLSAAGLVVALLAASAALEHAWGERYRDGVGFVVDPLLVALLMTQLIAFRDSPAVKWLDHPVARYLGRISYSIYLYQQVLTEPVAHLLSSLPRLVQVGASVLAVTGAATLSHYLVERPFLRLKTREEPVRRPVRTGVSSPAA